MQEQLPKDRKAHGIAFKVTCIFLASLRFAMIMLAGRSLVTLPGFNVRSSGVQLVLDIKART